VSAADDDFELSEALDRFRFLAPRATIISSEKSSASMSSVA
jgi:hypothetical protein